MSLILMQHAGAASAVVQIPTGHYFGRARTMSEPSPCYSGAKFDADGSVYAMSNGGSWQQVGTWLQAGTNSNYYLVRTLDLGTLTVDAGAGPLQLNTDREYYITYAPSGGSKITTVGWRIEDVSTNILATGSYQFIAEGYL